MGFHRVGPDDGIGTGRCPVHIDRLQVRPSDGDGTWISFSSERPTPLCPRRTDVTLPTQGLPQVRICQGRSRAHQGRPPLRASKGARCRQTGRELTGHGRGPRDCDPPRDDRASYRDGRNRCAIASSRTDGAASPSPCSLRHSTQPTPEGCRTRCRPLSLLTASELSCGAYPSCVHV